MKGFNLGDRVTWTSTSKGITKTKEGVILEIVAPGNRPNRQRFPQLFRGCECGMGRDHISFVVGCGKFSSKPYWPVVKNLRKING